MSSVQTPPVIGGGNVATAAAARPRRQSPRRRGRYPREALAGWLFSTPAVVMIVVFMLVPILMALWVSLTNWTGQGSPFASGVPFAGGRNYAQLLVRPGLERDDFMTSIRNTLYYVLLVVPIQTALALFLAMVVNQRRLVGRTFFRTAFYFPSVTSSVAISIVFLYLFTGNGAINALLAVVGIRGPSWFNDSDGLLHLVLGGLHLVDPNNPPAALAGHGVLGLSWWDWLSGPSVAMCAIIMLVVWTTSGTFMLIFLAALQDLPMDVEESSILDGANAWQRLWHVTLPQLRPQVFLVITLGLIGSWQVFDQIFIVSQGGPAKTTLSPAYLSYTTGFGDQQYPAGAAMSFVLFAIIVLMTLVQRFVLRDRDDARTRRAERRLRRTMRREAKA
ncbi:MAG TPA: sugar ABC transporter permease [Pseudonocardiaceae bacterium]|nr:sugar ABC transporter permease [Pseudonocardiaceae bacterium]